MAITKPPVLPAWAESGDRVTPSNAEIQVGWPLSSIPPSRQRFNWLLNFLANGVRYFTRRGLPDYDAAETYMIGDRIIGDDGKTYRSLIDTNLAQTPSTSPTKWELWALTQAQADGRVQNSVASIAAAAGTADAITGAFNPAVTALTNGMTLYVRSGSANATTTPTFKADGTAAKPIVKGNGLALAAGDIAGAGHWVEMQYDQTLDKWVLLNPAKGVSLDFTSNFSASGYQKLPSGLIIQWLSGITSAGGLSVTFPITFPNACRQVVVSLQSGSVSPVTASANVPNTTGVGVYTSNTAGAGVSANFTLIAIGN